MAARKPAEKAMYGILLKGNPGHFTFEPFPGFVRPIPNWGI